MEPARRPSKIVAWLGRGLLLTASVALGLVLAELVARAIEPKSHGSIQHDNDAVLGWVPRIGHGEYSTPEFSVHYDINALRMNDQKVTPAQLAMPQRVLALGDSHTFAVGVNPEDTWPNLLEAQLFNGNSRGTVWNAGVKGYSVGQYLTRFRSLKDVLKPNLVLVGFSMATDLYDISPPTTSGFVYGGKAPRTYFTLDGNHQLVEHTSGQAKSRGISDPEPSSRDESLALRQGLQRYALYRLAKQSAPAMWLALRLHPGGTSLWPGMDTALKVTWSPVDRSRWMLVEKILAQLAAETQAQGAPLVLVNIPYLPQVYDEAWNASFGSMGKRYDRTIANQRLGELCARNGIGYIDTTDALIQATHARGRWMHFKSDRHPTAEGQRVIADAVRLALQQRGYVK
jgi:lysophospholipase L1-like esterase